MKQNYSELPNGYLESINKGINAVRNFRGGMTEGKLSRDEAIARLKMEIETADAIVIVTEDDVVDIQRGELSERIHILGQRLIKSDALSWRAVTLQRISRNNGFRREI